MPLPAAALLVLVPIWAQLSPDRPLPGGLLFSPLLFLLAMVSMLGASAAGCVLTAAADWAGIRWSGVDGCFRKRHTGSRIITRRRQFLFRVGCWNGRDRHFAEQ